MTGPDLAAIALLDEPMRRRLYDFVVGQHRPVGREEAATALGITRPLATFHLDRLAAGGLLDAGYQRLNDRRGPGAGRPSRVYWRADREVSVSLPERRYVLAARTLAQALEGDPSSARAAAHEAGFAAGRRIGEEARRGVGGRRRSAKLLQRVLADQGYEPEGPGPDGTIRLRNCPYHALVAEHRPLVCGMNLAMAEGMTDAIGTLPVRPVLDPEPGYCCVRFVPA